MTRFDFLVGLSLLVLCQGHTIRKHRKTIISNKSVFVSEPPEVLSRAKKAKKSPDLDCIVKHAKKKKSSSSLKGKASTFHPSPAPTSSTLAPTKSGKGAKGEYCPTMVSACSLLEMEEAEFETFDYVLDMKLAITESASEVMETLEEYLQEELGQELSACIEFDVRRRRRLQDTAIMKVDLDVTEDTTTPCTETLPITETCINVDVSIQVTHDEGDAAVIQDSLLQAVKDRCEAIKDLEGISDTFDPCPYIAITGGSEEGASGGNGDGTGDSSGMDGGSDGSSGTGDSEGDDGADGDGVSNEDGGDNSGSDGSESSPGDDNNENGEDGTGADGGDGTGEGSSAGDDGAGENVDGDDGTGDDGTGDGSTQGDDGTTSGGDSDDGSDEDGNGGGTIASVVDSRSSEQRVETRGFVVIGVSALLILLLLLVAARRRHKYISATKHKHFIDEIDDTDTYLKDSDEDSQENRERQVHVVGEADSVFSGWSGYTADRRQQNNGLYPEQNGGSLDESYLHQDVHNCASATCELCEQKRRAGIQFVPSSMPSHSSVVSTNVARHYMSDDTVAL